MTDEKKRRTSKGNTGGTTPDPQGPIQKKSVKAAGDIFSSSEATHLLDLNDSTSVLAPIDDNQPATKDIGTTPHKSSSEPQVMTTIFQVDNVENEAHKIANDGAVTATQILDQDSLLTQAKAIGNDEQATQMLDAIKLPPEEQWSDESSNTEALINDFDEPEERTAFFETRNESAQPNQQVPRKIKSSGLVDPTPRRSINETPAERSQSTSSNAPSPMPRASKSTAAVPKKRTSKSPKPRRSRKEKPIAVEGEESAESSKNQSPESPINAGVFATNVSQVLEDVVGEVVKESWKELPAEDQRVGSVSKANPPKRSKTLRRWIAVVAGFAVLIVLGFILRSPTTSEGHKGNKERARTVVLDEVRRLGLRLPVSDFSRRIRPGTDIFLLGRQDVFLMIDGTDQSKAVHADSLWTTLRKSRNISAVGTQLSGLKQWPNEIDIGVDMGMSIAEVERLNAGLTRAGVQQINLLTDSNREGGLGEVGLDVRATMSGVPSLGALNLQMKNATVTLSLIRPQSEPVVIASLETFEPRFEDKLNKAIDTFAYENPRISRAFLEVPRGLRLNQVMDLAKPLVHDERIPRVTIIPYEIQNKPKVKP